MTVVTTVVDTTMVSIGTEIAVVTTAIDADTNSKKSPTKNVENFFLLVKEAKLKIGGSKAPDDTFLLFGSFREDSAKKCMRQRV